MEVDFCGYATIALGAALALHAQPGLFKLALNQARITVEGHHTDAEWGASFQSPPTRSGPAAQSVVEKALDLFGLTNAHLDPKILPAIAHGGGDHLVLGLKDHETLWAMTYDLAKGRIFAEREGLVTISLVHAETDQLFHARNPFSLGGVYEDSATGSAAAACAGYLRDLDWPHGGASVIRQVEDMGIPSLLKASIGAERGANIRVSGGARAIQQSQELDI